MSEKVQRRSKVIWSPFLILVTAGMCASGTLATISLKIAGTTYNFKHSMIQTFFMFIGEYLNILAFAVPLMTSAKRRNRYFQSLTEEAHTKKQDIRGSKLWVSLPSFIDALASGLDLTSLLLLPASISQMLQGGQIISTCIFAIIINKRSILRHQIAGIVFSAAGFFIVGIAGYISTNDESSQNYTKEGYLLGVVLILLNLALGGLYLNLEEMIMNRIAITPQRMVGLEGIFGLIWITGIIGMFSYMPCSDAQLCDIRGNMEDVTLAIKDVSRSTGLIFWSLTSIFSITFVNLTGVYATRLMSAMFRTFWKSMTVVLVWIISVAAGLETLEPLSSSIQVIGFIMLVIGNLTYNGLVKWPCLGISDDIDDDEIVAITNKYAQLQE